MSVGDHDVQGMRRGGEICSASCMRRKAAGEHAIFQKWWRMRRDSEAIRIKMAILKGIALDRENSERANKLREFRRHSCFAYHSSIVKRHLACKPMSGDKR